MLTKSPSTWYAALSEELLKATGSSRNDAGDYPWVSLPMLVQGKDSGISEALPSEDDIAAAERRVFDEIQARAAEQSFSFWSDPAEDLYEDAGEQ